MRFGFKVAELAIKMKISAMVELGKRKLGVDDSPIADAVTKA